MMLYELPMLAVSFDAAQLLIPVAIVAGIGLIAGVGLAIASAVMAVPVDEKAEEIESELPGANCGACGFSGCSGYAKALSQGRAKNGLCAPGGESAATAIAGILGQSVEKMEKKAAIVHCIGTSYSTSRVREYRGVSSCAASAQLFGGAAACSYGCLGYGDCVKACPYGAISVCSGVARVEPELCRACGLCLNACPRGIISIEPLESAAVYCSNHDKGGETRRACRVGCIGCMRCVKACETGAISINQFCAVVNAEKCTKCGECVKVCPNDVIYIRDLAADEPEEDDISFLADDEFE